MRFDISRQAYKQFMVLRKNDGTNNRGTNGFSNAGEPFLASGYSDQHSRSSGQAKRREVLSSQVEANIRAR
jgi:hypothetical protein